MRVDGWVGTVHHFRAGSGAGAASMALNSLRPWRYRGRPAHSARSGTLAAGHYFFCLCKKSNQKKHTLFVRRSLRGRSPAGRVCSGARRGNILLPRRSTGHTWPVAPCAHTPSRRPLKGTRKNNSKYNSNNYGMCLSLAAGPIAFQLPSPLVGEGASKRRESPPQRRRGRLFARNPISRGFLDRQSVGTLRFAHPACCCLPQKALASRSDRGRIVGREISRRGSICRRTDGGIPPALRSLRYYSHLPTLISPPGRGVLLPFGAAPEKRPIGGISPAYGSARRERPETSGRGLTSPR